MSTTVLCIIDECKRTVSGRGLCQSHYYRAKKSGDLERVALPSQARPDYHPRRQEIGTRRVAGGYIMVKTEHGWKPEHRLVMSAHLGRELALGENVHHINGFRNDNRLENLELWASPPVYGQRVADLIDFVVTNYPDEVAEYFKTRTLPVVAFGRPTLPTAWLQIGAQEAKP